MATAQALFETLQKCGAFKLGNVESRLAPLQNTCIHIAAPKGRRRRHSFCGVPSWHQQEMFWQSNTSDSDIGSDMLPPRATSEPTIQICTVPCKSEDFQATGNWNEMLATDRESSDYEGDTEQVFPPEACKTHPGGGSACCWEKCPWNEMLATDRESSDYEGDTEQARMNRMVKDLVEEIMPGGCSQRSTCADSTTSIFGGSMDKETTMMAPSEEVTAMMIRNMRNRLKQSDLVEELDNSGFAGTYDWLYMPSHIAANTKTKGGGQGKGFAFVNFINPEFATRFKAEWHRSRRFRMSRKNVLDVSVAICQGKHKNNEMFMRGKTSRIMSVNFRPHEPPLADASKYLF